MVQTVESAGCICPPREDFLKAELQDLHTNDACRPGPGLHLSGPSELGLKKLLAGVGPSLKVMQQAINSTKEE